MTPNHFATALRAADGLHVLEPQPDLTAIESLRISQMLFHYLTNPVLEQDFVTTFMRDHNLERHFRFVPHTIQKGSWL